MDERSLVGQKKYGQTMEQEVTEGMKDLSDFLDDTQEEIMDALLYIQAAKKCLKENIIYTSNFEVQLGVAWEFPRSMSDSAINSFMRKVNKHIARKLAMENDQNEQS